MEIPRTTVVRHESAFGSLELVAREPAAALRPHVAGYWGYDERTPGPLRRREAPHGNVVVILSLGPDLLQLEPDEPEAHGSFVAGLYDESVVIEHAGVSRGVQVNVTPLAAHMLLGVAMHTVAHRIVAVEDLLGRPGSELVERLHDAPTWEARFRILDDVLASRLAGARPSSSEVAWAWRRLVETDGRVAVGALADELGWSRKRLVARFREQVGLPPKALARILRFQHALRLLDDGRHRSWAEIAFACGYYDQAHLIRDFRGLAGSTPTEYVARRYPDGLGLAPE
jgi:AraC-like DNA-binding protein